MRGRDSTATTGTSTTGPQLGESSNTTTEEPPTSSSETTVSTKSTPTFPLQSETSTPPSATPPTVESTAPPVDSHRLAKLLGSVLGALFMLTLAILVYLYCRRRRARRITRIDAGLSTSSQKDRIVVSDRPWYKSPAYSFPRPWARSGYTPSEFSSTSGSESKTHKYTSSELSFSTITPSDSVSQAGHPSKVHKSQIKRKPLRTSTDLSTVPETRESKSPRSVNGSTAIPSSEVLDRQKPVFPHPIPDNITTSATPQTSVVS
ncbi:hypothetical protein PQX77_014992 [Marasmius sp. AFHP31]|nr:hypothetical protein PQX77_014992 [Marasmius sp. AFHP31]